MATKVSPASPDEECFFIAPIGDEGSPTRERSDGVLDYIVTPAALELGLVAWRADRIDKPGMITTQVIGRVLDAKAAVVDLTDLNPNVFYEMAIRHTAHLPTALIAEEGCKLPFDIAQMRTIFFRSDNLKSANECKAAIVDHLREAIENGATDSPVTSTKDIQSLLAGTPFERTIAELVETTEGVAQSQMGIRDGIERIIDRLRIPGPELVNPAVLEDLMDGLSHMRHVLTEGAQEQADPRLVLEIAEVMDRLQRPIDYLFRNADPEMAFGGRSRRSGRMARWSFVTSVQESLTGLSGAAQPKVLRPHPASE